MTNEEAINVLRGQERAYWATLSEAEHKAFDLAIDALELLKEQEAVEPVEEFIKGTNRHKYHCKRCGNIVGTILDDKHPIFPGVKLSIKHFCDVCGQAVKWE